MRRKLAKRLSFSLPFVFICFKYCYLSCLVLCHPTKSRIVNRIPILRPAGSKRFWQHSNTPGRKKMLHKIIIIMTKCLLLQLDANLIEGEPYNCLSRKRRLNVALQNSNISEMWETGFQNPPTRTPSVLGLVQCHQHTDFFAPSHPPMGQKTSLVNFKHEITTSANYT